MPALQGMSFEYQVGDYHLRLTFQGEHRVHWQYLAAPDGLTGKHATESIDEFPIRDDVVMVGWKEADGTQVLDVLDLREMVMHANFVTADGQRVSAQSDLRLVDT